MPSDIRECSIAAWADAMQRPFGDALHFYICLRKLLLQSSLILNCAITFTPKFIFQSFATNEMLRVACGAIKRTLLFKAYHRIVKAVAHAESHFAFMAVDIFHEVKSGVSGLFICLASTLLLCY